jgi:hypothetical protein
MAPSRLTAACQFIATLPLTAETQTAGGLSTVETYSITFIEQVRMSQNDLIITLVSPASIPAG